MFVLHIVFAQGVRIWCGWAFSLILQTDNALFVAYNNDSLVNIEVKSQNKDQAGSLTETSKEVKHEYLTRGSYMSNDQNIIFFKIFGQNRFYYDQEKEWENQIFVHKINAVSHCRFWVVCVHVYLISSYWDV